MPRRTARRKPAPRMSAGGGGGGGGGRGARGGRGGAGPPARLPPGVLGAPPLPAPPAPPHPGAGLGGGSRCARPDVGLHPLREVQPAQTPADRRVVRRTAPERRRILAPNLVEEAVRPQAADALLDGHGIRPEVERVAIDRLGQRREPLRLQRRPQAVPRLGELADALLLEPPRDGLEIDPEIGEPLQHLARALDASGEARLGPAVIAVGVERFERDGGDGARPDEGVDVLHVAVGGVLGAGAGPQEPLGPRAARREIGEPAAAEDVLVHPGGGLRARDGDLAHEELGDRSARTAEPADAVELGVDEHVDAAQEEARDRRHPTEVRARRGALLEPGEVRVRHLAVPRQPEEQRHVDVDPLGHEPPDGRHSLAGRRHLDERVGAADGRPEPARLGDRRRGVVGSIGRHLQAHEAVGAVGPVEHRAEEVRGALHVVDGERLEHLVDALPLERQRPDGRVVVVAARDRLLEDGRVRGDSADPVLGDPALELTRCEHAAADEVDPHALAERGEREQRVMVHGLRLRRRGERASIRSTAFPPREAILSQHHLARGRGAEPLDAEGPVLADAEASS